MIKNNKWLAAGAGILFLSLAANFFMAGMILGESFAQQGNGASPMPPQADIRQSLPERDRAVIEKSMADNEMEYRTLRKNLEDARRDVAIKAKTDPFDQEALDAALKVEKEKKMDILRFMRRARQDAAAQMSPEGRAVMRRLHPESGRHDGGGMDRHGDERDDGKDSASIPFIWEELPDR